MKMSHENNWPTGISSTKNRWANNDYNLNLMKNYIAYYVTEFSGNVILLVPEKENRHMPSHMRLNRDFYVIIELPGVSLDK